MSKTCKIAYHSSYDVTNPQFSHRHKTTGKHTPIIIRGYEKLRHIEELVRRGDKFLRVAKWGQVSLPLLAFMTDRKCTIIVILRDN